MKEDILNGYFVYLLSLNPSLGTQAVKSLCQRFFWGLIARPLKTLVHFSLWHLGSPALKTFTEMSVFPPFRAAAM